jgi:hypothetical protein
VAFGFGGVTPAVEELARKDRVFMLGRKPWRIDVLTGIDGVSFREAWAGRVEAEFVASPLLVVPGRVRPRGALRIARSPGGRHGLDRGIARRGHASSSARSGSASWSTASTSTTAANERRLSRSVASAAGEPALEGVSVTGADEGQVAVEVDHGSRPA